MNRQVFGYLVPYWRRLILVLAISLISTATTLVIPYLSKDLIDHALVGRDLDALRRIVYWFVALGVLGFILNVTSGLRYTRVSAEILFDMRLSLYAHLQRLSPRFYARTRLGDIVSRLNNDISEIQRVAAEAALAWVGNVLFLIGSLVMMVWLDWRLAIIALAPLPISLVALAYYRRRLESRIADLRQRSADIGSFLIETLQATSLVVASNAQQREQDRFRGLNGAFIDALMRMQRVTYFAGGLPGTVLSIGSAIAFFYGGLRVIEGTLTLGTMGAFLAYQMRVFAPAQALMGLYASLTTAKVSWLRVLEILDAKIDVIEAPDAKAIANPQRRARVRSGVARHRSSRACSTRCRSSRGRARRWRSSAAAASASRRSPTSRRACSILMPASFASTARICARSRSRASAGTSSSSSRSRRCCTPPSRRTFATSGRARPLDDVRSAAEAAGIARFIQGLPQWIRDHGRRARPGGVGRRAAAHRAGARVSRRSRGARDGRTDRGARCDRAAPDHRRLSRGDARPHDDPDHPPPRSGDGRRSRRASSTARASSIRAVRASSPSDPRHSRGCSRSTCPRGARREGDRQPASADEHQRVPFASP